MIAGGASNIGHVRKDNEDSYFMDSERKIFLVADGMGGHAHGKLASSLAVSTFVNGIKELCLEKLTLHDMENLLNDCNHVVHCYQEEVAGVTMGTTFTVVVVGKEQMQIGHIGDSRLYLLRNGQMVQLTHDDSFLAELARLGELQEENSDKKLQKNVLLKALGPEENINGQYIEHDILQDDYVILCTDGLYNYILIQEMNQAIIDHQTVQEAVDYLMQLALARGGTDNLTLIIYHHEM